MSKNSISNISDNSELLNNEESFLVDLSEGEQQVSGGAFRVSYSYRGGSAFASYSYGGGSAFASYSYRGGSAFASYSYGSY